MKNSNLLFIALHIVAWIIFVALCIEAGGLVVNFYSSIFYPEWLPRLYQKLDLLVIYDQNKRIFYSMYSFILSIALLKSYLFYLVVKLLYTLDMNKPFNKKVAQQITLISYFTLSIGLVSYVASQTANNLSHHGYELHYLNQFWVDSGAFIIMSAIVYVIAAIFSRGVELQLEQDLTV